MARTASQESLGFITHTLMKPYGLYECVVNASGTIFRKTVVIKERGKVVIKRESHLPLYAKML